jgi:hypothetical protein
MLPCHVICYEPLRILKCAIFERLWYCCYCICRDSKMDYYLSTPPANSCVQQSRGAKCRIKRQGEAKNLA